MATYTRGLGTLTRKGVSFTSGAILDLDILEGIAPEGSPQEQGSMEIEEGLLIAVETEAVQIPPGSTTVLPPLALDMSPFEGLIDRPLEPVGAQSFLFSPVIAQHMVSTLLDFS